jgi:hypothetical protein
MQTCLLREEQVRALHNVLEVWLAIRVDERGHIRDVDSLRTVFITKNQKGWGAALEMNGHPPSTTRNKQISPEPQMRAIPEIRAIQNHFPSFFKKKSSEPFGERSHKKETHMAI